MEAAVTHNHDFSQALFSAYSSTQMAISQDMIEITDFLRKTDARKKGIQAYISKNTDASRTIKDISNLVIRLKARETGAKTSAELIYR